MNRNALTIEQYYYSEFKAEKGLKQWSRADIDRDVFERWLSALESGEYAQTSGRLHRVESNDRDKAGFCCLGVLSEQAWNEGIVGRGLNGDETTYHYGGAGLFPPQEVQDWAGLPDNSPVVWATVVHKGAKYDSLVGDWVDVESEGWHSVAEMNDEHGWTFDKIAAALRATYLD